MIHERTFHDVLQSIEDGTFYDDYDRASADLAILRAAAPPPPPPPDCRVCEWEGRRSCVCRNDRVTGLREALYILHMEKRGPYVHVPHFHIDTLACFSADDVAVELLDVLTHAIRSHADVVAEEEPALTRSTTLIAELRDYIDGSYTCGCSPCYGHSERNSILEGLTDLLDDFEKNKKGETT
jgi:hypothetical protein